MNGLGLWGTTLDFLVRWWCEMLLAPRREGTFINCRIMVRGTKERGATCTLQQAGQLRLEVGSTMDNTPAHGHRGHLVCAGPAVIC